MADSTDVFDIMHSTRAMRRLKPDPVPDDLIRKILEAGICAANGGNAQKWKFMVLKKPEIKKAVAVWYRKAFDGIWPCFSMCLEMYSQLFQAISPIRTISSGPTGTPGQDIRGW